MGAFNYGICTPNRISYLHVEADNIAQLICISIGTKKYEFVFL